MQVSVDVFQALEASANRSLQSPRRISDETADHFVIANYITTEFLYPMYDGQLDPEDEQFSDFRRRALDNYFKALEFCEIHALLQ